MGQIYLYYEYEYEHGSEIGVDRTDPKKQIRELHHRDKLEYAYLHLKFVNGETSLTSAEWRRTSYKDALMTSKFPDGNPPSEIMLSYLHLPSWQALVLAVAIIVALNVVYVLVEAF